MNKSIKDIFKKNITLLRLSDRITYYFRIMNYDAALTLASTALYQINQLLGPLLSSANYFNDKEEVISNPLINDLLNQLLNAQTKRDYILLADLYEIRMKPFLLRLQDIIMSKEEYIFDEIEYQSMLNEIKAVNQELYGRLTDLESPIRLLQQGYVIEYTPSGMMTLGVKHPESHYYLHSSCNVYQEALTLALSWYSEQKTEYIVFGLGLGYHIEALIELNNYANIEVYESDLNMFQMSLTFANLSFITKKPNVKLIYDPNLSKLMDRLKNIDDNTEFVIHHPSLRNIRNKDIMNKMDQYFIQYSSIKNQKMQMNGNFLINIKNYDAPVDALKSDFKGKDLYIVAAGPSLDKNYNQLKSVGENAIVLATGTVFRKLLNAGIKPDYLIVTDSNPRVYHQIEGYEKQNIPILFLSTAYKDFTINYKGEKYIICQKDYQKAEEYAHKMGYHLYNTGGSVSTVALDIGIVLGCRRIIFLGLDLAYTDNFVHAKDTSRREVTTTDDLVIVKDIHGHQIYTNKSLNMFRLWIENRIRSIKDIEIIDATEGGARIEGMQIKKLSDCIGSKPLT